MVKSQRWPAELHRTLLIAHRRIQWLCSFPLSALANLHYFRNNCSAPVLLAGHNISIVLILY